MTVLETTFMGVVPSILKDLVKELHELNKNLEELKSSASDKEGK